MAAEKGVEKERVYFRGLEDISYSLTDELKRMRDLPRVIKSKDLPGHDITGPAIWSRWVMEPDMKRMQSIQSHMVDLAPGGRSQKHGHMNEAVFYIVDGEGYDIHDGKRFDYEAGDIVVVYNGCVHQHFNKSQDKPLKTLVVKTKPMFLFMNLLFQSVVERAPKQVVPGFEDWKPENF